MSAHTESDDQEVQDIVNCVALFYEQGKSGSSFLRKEKFQAQLRRKVNSLKTLKEAVTRFFSCSYRFLTLLF